MNTTPLEPWIAAQTGGDLARWQLQRLNETLACAGNARWYRERLPRRLEGLEGLQFLPLMSAQDLRAQETGLVCVSQQEVARIVTLDTSGSTGGAKRVYFTRDDQELTLDFFHHGLSTVARAGERMAVLLPCNRAGGVGDLICRALERGGVVPVPYGFVTELAPAAVCIAEQGIETLVGTPVQVLALARYCAARALPCRVRAVLLSTDYVARTVKREIETLWGCTVYEHYGMTETGLGGAVDCDAHRGLHIRENDLLVEIVDETGAPVADGIWGEVVVTTLTRRAMPLIRYRTGDISRILPGSCPCGSALRRMAPVQGRLGGAVALSGGGRVSVPKWDEALLALDGISDYRIFISADRCEVVLEVETQQSLPPLSGMELEELLHGLLPSGTGCEVRVRSEADCLTFHTGKKRMIHWKGAPQSWQ